MSPDLREGERSSRIGAHCLVTLSGCETGYNEIHPGDELIGLARALSYAGASSLLVTLVEDRRQVRLRADDVLLQTLEP